MKALKTDLIRLRVTREEKKALRKAAHLKDATLSQWVRATLLTEARKA